MHPRFHQAFQQLSPPVREALHPIVAREGFAGALTAAEVATAAARCRLSPDELAFALLPLAAACAVAPVSHFQVGAIAQGISGNFYFGANLEFSDVSIQQTVHAEQSAITHAWLPDRPPALLTDYLPDAFGPRDLAIDLLLMDDVRHGYPPPGDDPLLQAAVDAANRSHAPYSQSFSGVALESATGRIYAGRYAENAAFNPSLPPAQAALSLMNLAGEDLRSLRRAALAERRQAPDGQWENTRALLASLGCGDTQRIFLD